MVKLKRQRLTITYYMFLAGNHHIVHHLITRPVLKTCSMWWLSLNNHILHVLSTHIYIYIYYIHIRLPTPSLPGWNPIYFQRVLPWKTVCSPIRPSACWNYDTSKGIPRYATELGPREARPLDSVCIAGEIFLWHLRCALFEDDDLVCDSSNSTVLKCNGVR